MRRLRQVHRLASQNLKAKVTTIPLTLWPLRNNSQLADNADLSLANQSPKHHKATPSTTDAELKNNWEVGFPFATGSMQIGCHHISSADKLSILAEAAMLGAAWFEVAHIRGIRNWPMRRRGEVMRLEGKSYGL